jgi:hypothetical protein
MLCCVDLRWLQQVLTFSCFPPFSPCRRFMCIKMPLLGVSPSLHAVVYFSW